MTEHMEQAEKTNGISEAEKLRFKRICFESLGEEMSRRSIGMYKEKRLHAILKRYFCPDTEKHEVRIGSYTADILDGDTVYEIQTGSFFPMQKKIEYYLQNTEYKINAVCPLAANKWVSWIDPQNGSISAHRRSPKQERTQDALREMFWLSSFLADSRLTVTVMLLGIEEYRILDGWDTSRKKGSGRYERIPVSLIGVETFCTAEDYCRFLPEPYRFTASEFAKHVGLKGRGAYYALHTLEALGLVSPTDEKIGRAVVWQKNKL